MNETFLTTPISVETFAQRLIALDVLRHAIVDLWDFADRERRSDGFTAADVLRLEEIRQIVLAERPLLPVSRETALQYKEFLRSRNVFHALPPDPPATIETLLDAIFDTTGSPREKSNDEYTVSASPSPSNTLAPPLTVAAGPMPYAGLPASRSAAAPRKTDRPIRNGGKKRRRRRPSAARRKNKGH